MKVTQLCLTVCNSLTQSMEFSSQEYWMWVAYPFSSGSSQLRNRTGVSCISGRFFTNWAIREALGFCLLEDFLFQFQFPYLWFICSYFLFLPGSILEVYTFLKICPFLPSCPFYWHIVAHSSLLWSFVFLCCLLWSLHFNF